MIQSTFKISIFTTCYYYFNYIISFTECIKEAMTSPFVTRSEYRPNSPKEEDNKVLF